MDTSKLSRNSLGHPAQAVDESSIKVWTSEHHAAVLPYLEAILLDGFNLCKGYGFADYQKDLSVLKRRHISEGFGFLTSSLPILFNGLCDYLENGKVFYPSYALFKGGVHPRFLSGLFKILCDDTGLYEEKEQAQAFDVIYQLTQGFKKLDGPFSEKVLRKNLADFVQKDRSLMSVNFNAPNIRPIFEHARAIITSLFHNTKMEFQPSGELHLSQPGPGSGATATRVEKHMRYRPRMLYTQLNDVFPYDNWWNTTYQYVFGDTAVEYENALQDQNAVRTFPVSKFLYVPKVLGKPRGICEEENEVQYFQQGIRRLMYTHIEQSRWAGHVNFTDQNINRDLALESSANKRLATIDMSSASNMISRELVLALFRDTPLFEYLDAVSTRIVQLPEGLGQAKYLLSNMYAPMGSGVCFPVMGVVHYALILGILATNVTIKNIHETFSQVYVYGDDILCPTRVANLVCDTLPKFGMIINKEKSFINSHFRESCGCHAYKGVDVTPAFFQKVPLETSSETDSTLLLTLLSKWQILMKKDYKATSSLLKRDLERIYGSLPYVHSESAIVGFPTNVRANLNTLRPYIKGVKCSKEDPQQKLYKLRVVIPRDCTAKDYTEHDAYLRCILEKSGGSLSQSQLNTCLTIAKHTGHLGAGELPVPVDSDNTKVRSAKNYYVSWRWVAEPAIY